MRTLLLAGLLAGTTTGAALAQQGTPAPILPDAARWQANPAVPGAESTWMLGAADQAGLYAQRVKLAHDAKIAPHTHSDERFSVVLEGSIFVGFGETFDPENVVEVPQGAIYVAPAGVPHYVWAKDGAAMYQESGMGPTGTRFIPASGQ
jgi:quercetin dioxygenase-like cupin family protein